MARNPQARTEEARSLMQGLNAWAMIANSTPAQNLLDFLKDDENLDAFREAGGIRRLITLLKGSLDRGSWLNNGVFLLAITTIACLYLYHGGHDVKLLAAASTAYLLLNIFRASKRAEQDRGLHTYLVRALISSSKNSGNRQQIQELNGVGLLRRILPAQDATLDLAVPALINGLRR